MPENFSPFIIPGYQVRFIQEKDTGELQRLLERCVDYCMLVDGHPPRPSAALSFFSDFPPGKTSADLIMLGISNKEDNLVGFLHAVRDYPEKGACWIGLLVIDPDYRGHGVGKLFVQSFEDWMSSQGSQGILLGVVEENQRALKFWQSAGFEIIERRPPAQFDLRTHVVIVMAHALSSVKHV